MPSSSAVEIAPEQSPAVVIGGGRSGKPIKHIEGRREGQALCGSTIKKMPSSAAGEPCAVCESLMAHRLGRFHTR
jgi:hypothetical protein